MPSHPVTVEEWEARRRAHDAEEGDAYEPPEPRDETRIAEDKARLFADLRRVRDALVPPEERTSLPGDAPPEPEAPPAAPPEPEPEPEAPRVINADGRSWQEKLGIRPYAPGEFPRFGMVLDYTRERP